MPDANGALRLAVGYRPSLDGKATRFTDVHASRLAEVGTLVPIDAAWHSVCIQVTGQRHRVSVDGKLLLDAAANVSDCGKLRLGPGWRSWQAGLPYADIDDIVVRTIGPE